MFDTERVFFGMKYVESEVGIVLVTLPDEYGEQEARIAVREFADVRRVDNFIDLGGVQSGETFGDILDVIEKAHSFNDARPLLNAVLGGEGSA